MCRKYAVSYGPILENEAGDLALNNDIVFEDAGSGIGVFPSPEGAVAAWVCNMRHQNINLVELPRRRGFGLIYSACPPDGADSFLINVEVHEYGVGSTN